MVACDTISGSLVVEAFEVQCLKPIAGWVDFSSGKTALDDCKTFVPRAAFAAGKSVSKKDASPSLSDVIQRVERDLGLKRLACSSHWEPWDVVATADASGDGPSGGQEHWEYAFDAAHNFTVAPPSTASADAGGNRSWIRRRRHRRVGAVQWNDTIVPEDISALSVWVVSTKLDVPRVVINSPVNAGQDQQRSSEARRVPALRLPSREGSSSTLAAGMTPPASARTLTARSRRSSVFTIGGALVPVEHWMKDGDTQQCLSCGKAFGMITRRHHCRLCGMVYCSQCCGKDARYGGVRVCRNCALEAEESARQAAEEDAEYEARLKEMEEDLLLATSAEEPSSESSSVAMLIVQLEYDCRLALETEMMEEYSFLTSLGAKELSALEEIAAIDALPSLLQLSDSLRVVPFDRSLKQDQSLSLRKEASRSLQSPDLRPTDAHGAFQHPTEAIEVRGGTEDQTCGLLHLSLKSLEGTSMTMIYSAARLDVKIGDGPTLKGDWGHLSGKKSLSCYVMLNSPMDIVEVSVVGKGGNAITDLLLDWTTVIARFYCCLADLQADGTAQTAGSARDAGSSTATKNKGSARLPLVGQRKSSTSDDTFSAVVDWSFDARQLYDSIGFCPTCGRVTHKCVCTPLAEPYLLGSEPTAPADASRSEQRKPREERSKEEEQQKSEQQSEALPAALKNERSLPHNTEKELKRASEAWLKLVSCSAERMLLEKRSTVADVEAEQREAYGKLRNEYFKATNAALIKMARKRRHPDILRTLTSISNDALQSVARVYLSRWHRRAVEHGPERRLKQARARLEQRVGLLHAHNLASAASPPSHSPSDAPMGPQQPSHNTHHRSASPRKSTSTKCCSVM